VEAGQVLVVLEAMKMQNEIRASASGRVVRSQVQAGDTVEGRSLLLVIHSGPNP
jgi:acetyl-CoA/propionyl-CoA carboxylase biotin carboxyl carrier protein